MWPSPQSLLPLALVAAAFLLLAPCFGRRRPAARLAVIASVGAVIVHYLSWRVPVTVLPANDASFASLYVWAIFLIELLVLLDAAILFATLLRRTDRSAEAERQEARLRALDPAALPTVDVLIPTYNEPFEVLEKTIVGALVLDWPSTRLNVWVLDDGRRDWLRDFCREKGAGYLTRADNAHAKAGNVNAALRRVRGDFFAILDADFIPRRDMLFRMMGFFQDARVGIVQAPHNFFNHDPMQANLALRRTLPDDQRLFFDEIMAGRDGWNCAFCCGSNSITRRAALAEIGDRLPTGSITEDMLLTLTLLRRGYVTRYLNERLAIGLAPESLEAFFVQRARWARGALQILFLRDGPFGPGLSAIQRLLFLPTHWLTQSLAQATAMAVPAIYLLTGTVPLANATVDAVMQHQIPAVVAIMAALRFFAPGAYFPLAATVLGVLQAFRLLPTVLATLVRPFGHAFRVTPKGAGAAGRGYDLPTVLMSGGLIAATALGLLINSRLDWRIVDSTALIPIVAFWASYNMLILLLVAITSFAAPVRRAEERFELGELGAVRLAHARKPAHLVDLSLSGAQVAVDPDTAQRLAVGDWLWVDIAEVGEVAGEVVRRGEERLGVRFHLPASGERDRLIEKLFTSGLDNATRNERGLEVTLGLLARLFAPDPPAAPAPSARERPAPPAWIARDLASRPADSKPRAAARAA